MLERGQLQELWSKSSNEVNLSHLKTPQLNYVNYGVVTVLCVKDEIRRIFRTLDFSSSYHHQKSESATFITIATSITLQLYHTACTLLFYTLFCRAKSLPMA